MTRELNCVPVDFNDFNTIIICAVRYAIGRRTYITNDISNIVECYINNLTASTLNNIKREIKNAPSLGDDCDAVCWRSLLKTINETLAGRKHD